MSSSRVLAEGRGDTLKAATFADSRYKPRPNDKERKNLVSKINKQMSGKCCVVESSYCCREWGFEVRRAPELSGLGLDPEAYSWGEYWKPLGP
jgi:hypothetical protein